MNRRHVLCGLAAVGMGACDAAETKRREEEAPPPSASAAPPRFKFGTDLEVGIAAARREKRPLLVFFSAEWNVACKEQQKVYATPEFEKKAARFVAVFVDVTDDEAPSVKKAMSDHRVTGVPTTLLFDSSGNEVQRAPSLEPLEKWLERLAQVN